MFGKTREFSETENRDQVASVDADAFFGDEAAAEEAAKTADLADRVHQVEAQINSQFTSMAAYAQIAQEQIELARAESMNANERTERRVIELIERERADRIESTTGQTASTGWAAPDVNARLDALERAVGDIQHGLNECLERQKSLAEAITTLFEPKSATLPPPSTDGPIDELALS
jgi:chromosome segregation ATPase